MKEKENYVEEIAGHHRHSHESCKKKIHEMKELISDEVPERVAHRFGIRRNR